MDTAVAKAEGLYHKAAKFIADSITSEHAPKIALGAAAGYGLYKLATKTRLAVDRSADMTTTVQPPGAAEGGSYFASEMLGAACGDVSVDEVPALVSQMRQNFYKGLSRPFEVRLKCLNGIIRFFEENEDAIAEALRKDLGRPHFEAVVYDVLVPLADVKRLRDDLKQLMTPQRQPQDLVSFPAVSELRPEPLGVALVIDTWNYPIMLGVLPLAGALAAGNTAILKPSVVSRHTAELLGTVLPRYLDSSIARVVGHTAKRDRHMLTALLQCKTDKIFFTGSPKVGRIVYQAAAAHLTPVTLELGGKNPVLVHASADVDLAAKRTIWGRMMNAGQQCIAPDYVLVDKQVAAEFYAACAKWIEVFYEGKPEEPGRLGRIVDAARMQAQVGILTAHQGRVVCGGEYDEASRYVAPTVLQLDLADSVLAGETFGPILMCAEVSDMTEACKYVCAKDKALSMYIFSRDSAATELILQNTSAGGVTVNGTLMHVSHPKLPFGGVGASGLGGGYHGKATFDAFTHYKPVLTRVALPDAGLLSDLWVVYAPWNATKLALAKLLL